MFIYLSIVFVSRLDYFTDEKRKLRKTCICNYSEIKEKVRFKDISANGYNARKVISEVYASFVLQCTVSGR